MKERRFIKILYLVTLIIMIFTGFGQMPVFKRYYLADIPGLGWTADFYFTHYIHYLGAIFLIGLFSYLILDFFLIGRKEFRLSPASYFRVFIIAGIVLTGIFRVLKNLPNILFSPGFTLFIDTTHLGFTMIFLLTALLFKILKKGWVISLKRNE
ncbi:MAG: FeS-binding protein [bacterium]